jgi:hypothetical protein
LSSFFAFFFGDGGEEEEQEEEEEAAGGGGGAWEAGSDGHGDPLFLRLGCPLLLLLLL